ncbi:uncharacterized protein LOC119727716 [Patiria miniata]|uniref:Uncharacterized protein n=1 Tax=Patiria miniata TaxID=46514 RepID=A0A913ZVY2_PATMI|nr:uncharacterized protein LOC119727716 [Patiria miniata]
MARFTMLAIVVLCLIVGNQGADDIYTDMEFYAKDLTCNDEQSYCQNCFTARARGKVFLHTFEYVTNPDKFELSQLEGDNEWKMAFVQEDQSETFHVCTTSNTDGAEGGVSQQLSVCMENNFPGVVAPEGCSKPVALASLSDKFANMKMSGQQVMYCAQ